MRTRRIVNPKKLPVILNVADIAEIMRVSVSTAKSCFKELGFPRLCIIKRYLVLRDSFFEWLKTKEREEDEKQLGKKA